MLLIVSNKPVSALRPLTPTNQRAAVSTAGKVFNPTTRGPVTPSGPSSCTYIGGDGSYGGGGHCEID